MGETDRIATVEMISERLRKNREQLERDMDDSATKINAAELLERVESLRQRIEASRQSFLQAQPRSAPSRVS